MGTSNRVKPEHLPKKLETIRTRLGLKTEELIGRLNCPEVPLYRASISQYERGKREPPLLVLLAYARLVNVYVDVLIDDAIDLPERIPARKKFSR